jgi:hypothetical protein
LGIYREMQGRLAASASHVYVGAGRNQPGSRSHIAEAQSIEEWGIRKGGARSIVEGSIRVRVRGEQKVERLRLPERKSQAQGRVAGGGSGIRIDAGGEEPLHGFDVSRHDCSCEYLGRSGAQQERRD